MVEMEIWVKDSERKEVPLPPAELKELGQGMYQLLTHTLKQNGWRKSEDKKDDK